LIFDFISTKSGGIRGPVAALLGPRYDGHATLINRHSLNDGGGGTI
jgi:hypothetical protein